MNSGGSLRDDRFDTDAVRGEIERRRNDGKFEPFKQSGFHKLDSV